MTMRPLVCLMTMPSYSSNAYLRVFQSASRRHVPGTWSWSTSAISVFRAVAAHSCFSVCWRIFSAHPQVQAGVMTKYWLSRTADEAPGQKSDRFVESLNFSSAYMKKKNICLFGPLGSWDRYLCPDRLCLLGWIALASKWHPSWLNQTQKIPAISMAIFCWATHLWIPPTHPKEGAGANTLPFSSLPGQPVLTPIYPCSLIV